MRHERFSSVACCCHLYADNPHGPIDGSYEIATHAHRPLHFRVFAAIAHERILIQRQRSCPSPRMTRILRMAPEMRVFIRSVLASGRAANRSPHAGHSMYFINEHRSVAVNRTPQQIILFLNVHWVLSRMATLPSYSMGMARSGAPSWLKSPEAIEYPP